MAVLPALQGWPSGQQGEGLTLLPRAQGPVSCPQLADSRPRSLPTAERLLQEERAEEAWPASLSKHI